MTDFALTASDSGRVWFITGTSSGFGRVLAESVLAAGDRVVATARDVTTVSDLAEREPQRVVAVPLDVTDPATVDDAVERAIATFGQIDVLVNNAGRGMIGALEELTDEQTRAVLDTNVFGVLAVTRAVLPHMRSRRHSSSPSAPVGSRCP